MGYMDHQLMADERIICKTGLHWILLIPEIIFAGIVQEIYWEGPQYFTHPEDLFILQNAIIVLVVMIVVSFLDDVMQLFFTELVITTKQLVYKSGWLSTTTIEWVHGRIESMSVEANLVGRILGYGTLTINGGSGSQVKIIRVRAPFQFSKKVLEAINMSQNQESAPRKR